MGGAPTYRAEPFRVAVLVLIGITGLTRRAIMGATRPARHVRLPRVLCSPLLKTEPKSEGIRIHVYFACKGFFYVFYKLHIHYAIGSSIIDDHSMATISHVPMLYVN